MHADHASARRCSPCPPRRRRGGDTPYVDPDGDGGLDRRRRDARCPLRLAGGSERCAATGATLLTRPAAATCYVFENVASRPVPSLLRGCTRAGGPRIRLHSDADLAHLRRFYDGDPFRPLGSRPGALLRLLIAQARRGSSGSAWPCRRRWAAPIRRILTARPPNRSRRADRGPDAAVEIASRAGSTESIRWPSDVARVSVRARAAAEIGRCRNRADAPGRRNAVRSAARPISVSAGRAQPCGAWQRCRACSRRTRTTPRRDARRRLSRRRQHDRRRPTPRARADAARLARRTGRSIPPHLR